MASSNVNFEKLGLTDVALLGSVTADTPLLTVDFDLYPGPFHYLVFPAQAGIHMVPPREGCHRPRSYRFPLPRERRDPFNPIRKMKRPWTCTWQPLSQVRKERSTSPLIGICSRVLVVAPAPSLSSGNREWLDTNARPFLVQ